MSCKFWKCPVKASEQPIKRPYRYATNTGLPGSLIPMPIIADQFCNVLAVFTNVLYWCLDLALIGIDQQWSALRGISDQCQQFDQGSSPNKNLISSCKEPLVCWRKCPAASHRKFWKSWWNFIALIILHFHFYRNKSLEEWVDKKWVTQTGSGMRWNLPHSTEMSSPR